MSKLRAPGSSGIRSIRPPSGLTRPPQVATTASRGPPAAPITRPSPQSHPPTADTEFQVGDYVLVGGVKPGRIAFLGNTQFAQGIWAGIVLDTPEGKNDGSVKGVSYFKCSPNYGLFAKTDKLSPLPRQQQQQQQKPHPQLSEEVKYNIGDRVHVEGGKVGTIEFIGPTQFAKGIWVGVALDSPDGKNNGTVAGVQYFSCPPNYGLFTRTVKLTLATPTSSSVTPTNLPPPQPSQVAPPTATPSLDPTELKRKAESLSIGDRLLVNNSKEGTLRFIGPTHFAKGIWVGVELDEPQGKNDGAVSGKRYFQCPSLHGLFAPLPKVEKLTTVVTPPPVRRLSGRGLSGSPVSSVSSMSSMGRIRQLQQSAHMESEPLSPAQSDISANGSSLSHIMFEKDHQIATLKSSLEQTELEKVKLSEEITELRRKVDDLQFLLEEQDIISGDKLEKVTSKEQTELNELKELLAIEKANHQNTVAQLRELEQSQQPNDTTNTAENMQKLENEKEKLQGEINKMQMALTAAEGDFKTTEAAAKDLQSQFESTLQQLQETLDLCAQQEGLLEEKVLEIDALEEDKKQLSRDLERISTEKESLLASTEQLIGERDNALTQCNRLRAESSSATSEHSYLAEQCQELMQERDQLKQELRETKSLLERVNLERNDALSNLSELRSQGQEVHGRSQEINLKNESLQKELSEASAELNKAKRLSTVLNEEMEQLKLSGQQKIELAEANCAELRQRLNKSNKERELALEEAQVAADKMDELIKEREQLIQTSNDYQRLANELQEQLEDVTQQYNSLASEGQSHSVDIQVQLEDTEERLEAKMRELTEAKERITSLEEEIVVLSANAPDEERLLALEEDKVRLEQMVARLSSQNTEGGGADSQEIIELKEDNRTLQAAIQDKDQEINFLNSVIAELQTKVDSLESLNGLGDQANMLGYSSEEDILGSQLPPPRVFCDICDEFDLHDTGDCPMQAADVTDSPPPSMHHGIRTNERPYCENCEVFGHWSHECQYEETY